jgi:hypothetical protein
MNWTALVWLAAMLGLLSLAERWIHRHLQGTMLLLTGDLEVAVVLYALPLLPGIVLHELSHAVAALLMGVRVGRISIRPQRAGERVQLGFVPVEKTDPVRASLIGLAPLITGSAVITLIGYLTFGVEALSAALVPLDLGRVTSALRSWLATQDVGLWAYVVFTISNTMFPSRADRQAWAPVLLFLALLGGVVWVAGLGPTLVDSFASSAMDALRWLATMCTFTLVADVPFILLIALGEKVLERIKGMKVEY